MPVGHEEVLPAVVVEVEEPDAVAHNLGMAAQTGGKSHVAESAVTIVVIQVRRVVGKIGFGEVQEAVAVVVCSGNGHPALGFPFAAEGDAGQLRKVGKSPVVVVVVKNAGGGIGSHIQVGPAVVIVVEGDYAQRVDGALQQNSAGATHVGERPVAVVVIEVVSAGLESPRPTGGRNALVLAELAVA